MKKQIIAGMISAAMALTLLAGCGSSSSGSAAPAAGAGEAKSENKYELAYVLSTRDEFLGLLEDNVAAAAEELGVGMEMKYAGEDSQKMIDCISAKYLARNSPWYAPEVFSSEATAAADSPSTP